MEIIKHIKKRTGAAYWIAKGLTMDQENMLKAAGWGPTRFGEGLMTGKQDLADAAIATYSDNKAAWNSDEDPEADANTDYASMPVKELRPLVRSNGWNGAEMLNASKDQLIKYLETGEKPAKAEGVNTEELGSLLLGILQKAGVSGNAGVDEEAVKAIVQQEMVNAVHRIEIMSHTGEVIPVGVQHNMFEWLLRIASIQMDKGNGDKIRPIDTMLVGPAGSGKTTCCHAVAIALGIEFYAVSVGAQTTKTDLLGFIDATGHYHESAAYKAYKNGGLYLLDEVDAGNANVLTLLNAMLANGQYLFPNGETVKRHPDFVCFAAANTFGRGADRQYVGRNQLDAATLDRFAVVNFDYDEALERIISGASPKGGKKVRIGGANATPDEWCDLVQGYRRGVEKAKERVVISPRASQKGTLLLAAGFGLPQVEEMVIWKGIDKNIINKVVAASQQ